MRPRDESLGQYTPERCCFPSLAVYMVLKRWLLLPQFLPQELTLSCTRIKCFLFIVGINVLYDRIYNFSLFLVNEFRLVINKQLWNQNQIYLFCEY